DDEQADPRHDAADAALLHRHRSDRAAFGHRVRWGLVRRLEARARVGEPHAGRRRLPAPPERDRLPRLQSRRAVRQAGTRRGDHDVRRRAFGGVRAAARARWGDRLVIRALPLATLLATACTHDSALGAKEKKIMTMTTSVTSGYAPLNGLRLYYEIRG